MISRLRGKLLGRELGRVEIMTASGVGYEVEIPLTVYEKLPRPGADIELRTLQVFREDGVTLYGFLEETERAVFGRLLTASGVGPRLALNVLSTLAPERLVRAIKEKDIATLRRIPGLGAKKAERLVVELGDRVDDLAVSAARASGVGERSAEEAVSALVALGYSAIEATAAVRRALDGEASPRTTEELIRAALGTMGPA
jgi:Holliday junction DNA helicase RuvA